MSIRGRKKIRIGVGLALAIATLVLQLSPVTASETVEGASSKTVDPAASRTTQEDSPMGCLHVIYYENGTVDAHIHCCDDPGHPCSPLPYIEGFCDNVVFEKTICQIQP